MDPYYDVCSSEHILLWEGCVLASSAPNSEPGQSIAIILHEESAIIISERRV